MGVGEGEAQGEGSISAQRGVWGQTRKRAAVPPHPYGLFLNAQGGGRAGGVPNRPAPTRPRLSAPLHFRPAPPCAPPTRQTHPHTHMSTTQHDTSTRTHPTPPNPPHTLDTATAANKASTSLCWPLIKASTSPCWPLACGWSSSRPERTICPPGRPTCAPRAPACPTPLPLQPLLLLLLRRRRLLRLVAAQRRRQRRQRQGQREQRRYHSGQGG